MSIGLRAIGSTAVQHDRNYAIDHPSLTGLMGGNFVVAYNTFEKILGDRSGIFGNVFNSEGELVTEFKANTFSFDEQIDPEIAGLENGKFVVVWTSESQDGDSGGIYGQVFSAEGVAEGVEFRVNTTTDGNQSGPVIASLADGGFFVSWFSASQNGYFGQKFDGSGTSVGSEIALEIGSSRTISVSVADSQDATFLVTWATKDTRGPDSDIYGRIYNDNGTASGDEFRINLTEPGGQFNPSTASLADGSYIVSWVGSVKHKPNVFARLFSKSGVALSEEIHIGFGSDSEVILCPTVGSQYPGLLAEPVPLGDCNFSIKTVRHLATLWSNLGTFFRHQSCRMAILRY